MAGGKIKITRNSTDKLKGSSRVSSAKPLKDPMTINLKKAEQRLSTATAKQNRAVTPERLTSSLSTARTIGGRAGVGSPAGGVRPFSKLRRPI